jgi:hypothetical protein
MLGMCWINSGLAEEGANAPSLDLLEYLGMMVEEDDGLIGPEDLDDEPEPFPDSILIDDSSSSDQPGAGHD